MIRIISRVALYITLVGLVAACGGGGSGGGSTSPPAVKLSSITVTPTSASVAAGLTLQFTATGNYSDSTTKDLTSTVTWTSSDESKAIISATSGLATGRVAGTATITATYTNATTGTVAGNNTLTVAPPNLLAVVLSPKLPTLGVNKGAQLHAIGTYTDNSTQDVSSTVAWASSATDIVTITALGEAKALNQTGTSVISATLTGYTIAPVTLTVTAQAYAYATNFDGNSVSQYKIDGTNGTLTAQATGTVATDNQPFSISVAPTGAYVYVSSWNSSSVSQFQIGADGTLTRIGAASGSVATGHNPNAVTIDPFDKYAYVANLGDSTISQYKIGADGQLIPMTAPTVPSGNSPATIVIDPTGRFAYVGNFGSSTKTPPTGPSTISQYLVSQTDGSLTAMNGAAATAPTGSGPVAIAIDPAAKYLYVANLGDNNIGQYSINTDGTLTPLLTVTVPTGLVASGTAPAGIAIDYLGRYVYVANQGDGTVSQYAVGNDGSLTAIAAAVSTGDTGTSSVTVDPTGQFVYATNRGGATIAQFTIGGNGALSAATPLTVPAGTHPTSITTGY